MLNAYAFQDDFSDPYGLTGRKIIEVFESSNHGLVAAVNNLVQIRLSRAIDTVNASMRLSEEEFDNSLKLIMFETQKPTTNEILGSQTSYLNKQIMAGSILDYYDSLSSEEELNGKIKIGDKSPIAIVNLLHGIALKQQLVSIIVGLPIDSEEKILYRQFLYKRLIKLIVGKITVKHPSQALNPSTDKSKLHSLLQTTGAKKYHQVAEANLGLLERRLNHSQIEERLRVITSNDRQPSILRRFINLLEK